MILKKYFIQSKRYFTKLLLISGFLFLISCSTIFAQASAPNTTGSTDTSNSSTSSCMFEGAVNASLITLASGLTPGMGQVCYTQSGSFFAGTPNTTKPVEVQAAINKVGGNPDAYIQGNGYGFLSMIAANVSEPAVNTRDSVTFVANKLNANTAAAQSSALEGLSPLLVFHDILRNVSYTLIVAALLLTGFMIIIQNKSQKQGNVTAATGIANIITILIFITLSYPIAGIIVDVIINVGNSVVATLLDPFINSSELLKGFYSQGSLVNVMSLMGDIQRSGVSTSLVNLIKAGLENLLPSVQQTGAFLQGAETPAGALFTTFIGIYLGIGSAIAISTANSALILAIMSFTIFILIFRIVFTLLGAFISIAMQVMFAPLILISGAFPGQSAGKVISNWIKSIVGAALTFPVIFTLLLMSAVFLNFSKVSTDTDKCYYDNQDTVLPADRIYVPGTQSQQFDATTGKVSNSPVVSRFFDTKRFDANPATDLQLNDGSTITNRYSATRGCYPKLLPPKFNWLPAPIGYLGFNFSIDDFTRFVLGIAFIVLAPGATKLIQGALGLKPTPFSGTAGDALAGVGLFSGFAGQLPLIGKPLTQILGNVQSAIK